MTETEGKAKTKRPSKSERTYRRRLKEAARKPGGAMAVQMARVKAAGEASTKKKEKTPGSKPLEDRPPAGKPDE
jgi:hypothetical protein